MNTSFFETCESRRMFSVTLASTTQPEASIATEAVSVNVSGNAATSMPSKIDDMNGTFPTSLQYLDEVVTTVKPRVVYALPTVRPPRLPGMEPVIAQPIFDPGPLV